MSHLKYVTPFYACFLDALPSGLYRQIRWCRFLRNAKLYLGIYTGILNCIVKLPEEVCASHTKRVGESKKVLQLK